MTDRARGPRITHLDDHRWHEVRRQQHGPDAERTASVYEKWLDTGGDFLSLYARWDPGMMVQPHGHNSDHVVFVLEGAKVGVRANAVMPNAITRMAGAMAPEAAAGLAETTSLEPGARRHSEGAGARRNA